MKKYQTYLEDRNSDFCNIDLSLQGKGMNTMKTSEKLKSLSRRLQGGNLANFPFLDETVVEVGAGLNE